MDIQAEKVELIRLLTEVNSEKILKKIRQMLTSEKDAHDETVMTKRLKESRKQIAEGKGVKVNLDDIWK